MKKYVLIMMLIVTGMIFMSCSDEEGTTEPTTNNPISGEMITVQGGTYDLVDTSKQLVDTITVTVSNFSIGKYEVTQKEWEDIMGNNPAVDPTNGIGIGDDFPVFRVSWFDVLTYCNERSIAEDLTPCYSISSSTNPDDWGSIPIYSADPTFAAWNAVECNWSANGYRLPTEAEWEYAARGGAHWTDDYTYSGSNTIDDVACYDGNSTGLNTIGTKSSNQLGIYDMSGNLYEFCWDWYAYYTEDALDPTGAPSGGMRIVRGGAWSDNDANCVVDGRYREYPNSVFDYNGFRVVRRP